MEYTVLGDTVNLAARLMAIAPAYGIYVDQTTRDCTTGELLFKELPPIKVKGKERPVAIFKPTLRSSVKAIGLTCDGKIIYPWYDRGTASYQTCNEADLAANVEYLCGVSSWSGTKRFREMVGFTDILASATTGQSIKYKSRLTQVPPGSPFGMNNGIVVIEGDPRSFEEQENLEVSLESKTITHASLDGIDISTWLGTTMVSGTTRLLESLDPFEAAVAKMCACFSGPFHILDLAASSCSPWAGANFLDVLRLYKAVLDAGIIGYLPMEGTVTSNKNLSRNRHYGNTQFFQMTNKLIRAVGGAMLLDVQKHIIKRQALIDRVLARELPARMRTPRNRPHSVVL
eukprot:NODE_11326_length_1294_cov_4.569837.p1 GENE.NODE_11326_length_1294_cov_4.569837~~NODE_11326_length_1294_cov_4.569837.p1  ORF type:complete len:383 (-),score=54.54 NODE_11326_length_1294_cov_4.569837:144-1175(-)